MSLIQQSIEFNAPVWKVVFQNQVIGVCSKDEVENNYYLLNSDTLEVLESTSSPDLGGVEVLKGVQDGKMIFDVFPDMTDPANYSTVAFDLNSGKYYSVDPDNSSTDEQSIPLRYLEGTSYFQQVHDFIESRTSRDPAAAIDYMELPQHLIVSYYLYEDTGMSLILNIFDLGGQALFEAFLDRNLQAIGSEAFSLQNDSLLFVQEGRTLIKINLK